MSYDLTFTAEGKSLLPVVADPSGCQSVEQAGKTTGVTANSSTFWSSLGAALNVQGASSATFAGS